LARGWRRLHSEELHNLHTSLNIMRAIKSRRMTCAGCEARMRQRKMHIEFWSEKVKGAKHLEDLGGRIIRTGYTH